MTFAAAAGQKASKALPEKDEPTREAPARKAPTRKAQKRTMVVGILMAGLAFALVARAYRVQIRDGARYRTSAEAQQLRDVHLAPKRGTIVDRHGTPLAVSVQVESAYANPRTMREAGVDPEAAALQLATALGEPIAPYRETMPVVANTTDGTETIPAAAPSTFETLRQRLGADRAFVWIARHLTPEKAERIKALRIPGVQFANESRRFYPQGSLGAHMLGFADLDGRGIEGLELAYEQALRGTGGNVSAVRDRRGKVVFSDALLDQEGAEGRDLELTIDSTLQTVAERELSLAVRTFEARAGSIVVLDPQTGEVLAMASNPSYDPNRPTQSSVDARRFRAITDRFEPGSTLKPFTIAAAFAAGTLRPGDAIDCEQGSFHIGDDVIHDTHHYGVMSPAQVLAHSSNIGTAKIGFQLGREGLYRALRRFGFGERTEIGLTGETQGILRHFDRWYDLDFATISFGQGMSVTALQLAAAMNTLANGGRLMRPRLIRSIRSSRGEVIERFDPEVRRQTVPARISHLVAQMLTSVTGDDGTGIEAAIEGFVVAGKTGTAQKADYEHGGYARDRWISSFVGFVPAEAPRLVIAVIIDEPVIDHFGGVVAGPVFRRVGTAGLRLLGVHRRDVVPSIPSTPHSPRVVSNQALQQLAAEGDAQVPNLLGLDARTALVRAFRAGYGVQLVGTGVVLSQDAPIESEGHMALTLRLGPASQLPSSAEVLAR